MSDVTEYLNARYESLKANVHSAAAAYRAAFDALEAFEESVAYFAKNLPSSFMVLATDPDDPVEENDPPLTEEGAADLVADAPAVEIPHDGPLGAPQVVVAVDKVETITEAELPAPEPKAETESLFDQALKLGIVTEADRAGNV